MNQFSGELAALSAAFLWAASSVVYKLLGREVPPILLNFLKGIIAIAYLLITLTLTGGMQPFEISTPVGLLLLSGVLGIGLGDTAYFSTLNRLGARRTLLLETLASPLTALFALVVLRETLVFMAWWGILLTILGVAWVITERTPDTVINRQEARIGLVWGFVAVIAQASGSILSRAALANSDISPLWSTLLRLSAGTLVLLPLLLLRSRSVSEGEPQSENINLKSPRLLSIIALTAFGSTFLGIWLQQTAFKFSPAGIAQTLLATSPLFVLPIAAKTGEKVSIRAILGVLVSVAGIALLFSF